MTPPGRPGRGHPRARSPSASASAAGRARGAGRRRARGAARSPRRWPARHVGDRRAQAPLALGRHDPRGRARCAEIVQRLRARRRGGAVGAHRGGATSAARSTTCARRARPSSLPILRKDFTVDAYHAVRGQGRGRRRRAAGGGLVPRPRSWRELHAAAHELDLDAIVEVSQRRGARGGAGGRRRRDRDQQPRPRGLQRRHSTRPSSCSPTCPAGKIVVSESGISTREQIEELERVGVDAVLVGEA